MKRITMAALLALGAFAFARADEGAYKNLVGMARAAATDRGPDPDDAPPRAGTTDALKDSLTDVPSPRAAAAEPQPPEGGSGPGAVAVPAASQPRVWTLLYSTLLPPRRSRASLQAAFDPAVSTASFRAPQAPLPALFPPPVSEAVSAGERRGLAELMSTAAAKSGR
ncbi:MAG TPA: hypothetical protein VH309_01725 [Elusimicrobiota bacterium]|nr:hypothetical protein [Elusimicrobiota bacterium]